MVNLAQYLELVEELKHKQIKLIAVSKTKPVEDIEELYRAGQRDFGENYVQELVEKHQVLPSDIRWHFIGHLQTNKVKYIASFVHLIHSVDSFRLLKEINKQAVKNNRVIDVLLQVHIASEETKFGLDESELQALLKLPELAELENTRITGLMGMASLTEDAQQVRKEFGSLKGIFDRCSQLETLNAELQTLSMGMTGDYKIAAEEGSNMVRIGSLIFGNRNS
jgi:PLP dependent protein